MGLDTKADETSPRTTVPLDAIEFAQIRHA